MSNNKSTRVPLKRLLQPPQDHYVFYYFLDFNRNRFYYVDKFRHRYYSGAPDAAAMLHLSRCPEYQFCYAHMLEVRHQSCEVPGYYTSPYLIIEEKMMSRNEFFSQYALGTLEGVFVATRDREYLREYLTCHKLSY